MVNQVRYGFSVGEVPQEGTSSDHSNSQGRPATIGAVILASQVDPPPVLQIDPLPPLTQRSIRIQAPINRELTANASSVASTSSDVTNQGLSQTGTLPKKPKKKRANRSKSSLRKVGNGLFARYYHKTKSHLHLSRQDVENRVLNIFKQLPSSSQNSNILEIFCKAAQSDEVFEGLNLSILRNLVKELGLLEKLQSTRLSQTPLCAHSLKTTSSGDVPLAPAPQEIASTSHVQQTVMNSKRNFTATSDRAPPKKKARVTRLEEVRPESESQMGQLSSVEQLTQMRVPVQQNLFQNNIYISSNNSYQQRASQEGVTKLPSFEELMKQVENRGRVQTEQKTLSNEEWMLYQTR